MTEEIKWEIVWGKGSAYNMGRVKDNPFCSDNRLERYRNEKNKWKYFISDSREYCKYSDDREFDTMEQLNESAIAYLRRQW